MWHDPWIRVTPLPQAHSILHKGILARETISIAKDCFSEVAPDVAGKAGKCKRALYIHQKSPIYTPKEPYIYTKRALCTCKRASYTHQKLLLMSLARPVSAKEPYIYTKRALCTCKRASYTHQKLLLMSLARRVSAKEPDVYPERALYMHQKSPIRTPREPCVHAREPHIHTRSCSRRRWQGL